MTSPSPKAPAQSIWRAIAYLMIALVLFALVDSAAKLATERFSIGQVLFFRNAIALLPIAVMLQRVGWGRLRTRRLRGHMTRSVLGLSAMGTLFWSFTFLPLPEAIAIEMSAPIFVTALSIPLLGEKVGWRRWSAVGAGFAGILLITRPGVAVFQWGALLALISAVFFAGVLITIRRLGETEHPVAIAFYFTLFCTIVSGLSLPFVWTTPDIEGLIILTIMGLCGGAGQVAMNAAYRLVPASLLAPYQYMSLVYAALLGWVIWGDVPTVPVIAGAGIIAASGIYIAHREALVRRRQARADAASGVNPA